MPWQKIEFSSQEWRHIDSDMRAFNRKARFLVDENVPKAVSAALRGRGYNVRTVEEMGIAGRADSDIYQMAKREDRVLVTQDRDFLSERRFPVRGSPGIAILPSSAQGEESLARAFGLLLAVHGDSHDLWYAQRVVFPGDDTVLIRTREPRSGRYTEVKFKFPANGTPMVWQDK